VAEGSTIRYSASKQVGLDAS